MRRSRSLSLALSGVRGGMRWRDGLRWLQRRGGGFGLGVKFQERALSVLLPSLSYGGLAGA